MVTDLDFSPFDDFLLATGSTDRMVSEPLEELLDALPTPSWGLLSPLESLGPCSLLV